MLRRHFIESSDSNNGIIKISYVADSQQFFCTEENGIKEGDVLRNALYSPNATIVHDINEYLFLKEDYDVNSKIGNWYFTCKTSPNTIATGFQPIDSGSIYSVFLCKDMQGTPREFTQLEISEGVESIKVGYGIPGIFGVTNDYLNTIILPQSLKYIDDAAFYGFTNVVNVIGGDNLEYINNVTTDSTIAQVFGYGFLESLSMRTDQYSKGKVLFKVKIEPNVKIPENFNQYYPSLFLGGEEIIETIELPNKLTSIYPEMCINFIKLNSINLDNIISIGEKAFNGCTNLTHIELPRVKNIGEQAFRNTSVKEVILGDDCTTIEQYAFGNCSNLEIFRIPKNIEINITSNYGWNIFNTPTKNIKKVICATESVTSSKVQSIFHYSRNSIQEVIFEDNIKIIPSYIAYNLPNLTKITLSKNTEIIKGEVFYANNSLNSITLPKTVKVIEDGAFRLCSSLDNIIYEGTVEEWSLISKGSNWNDTTPATVVHCSDGNVAL